MPRVQPKTRPYKNYTEEHLQAALASVNSGQMSLGKAAEIYGISKSTLNLKKQMKYNKNVGRPSILTEANEKALVSGLIAASKWGFPLTFFDIRCIVKHFLDSNDLRVTFIKNNMPGVFWVRSFLQRHKNTLAIRLKENIKLHQSKANLKIINKYFNELKITLKNVNPEAILNYDEINITYDPGNIEVFIHHRTKHAERIIDASKMISSIMFSGTAAGYMLPVYINSKTNHLHDAWIKNTPKKTRLNSSQNGWFDTTIFEDWYFSIVLPYFRKLGDQPKVMIGNYLASHISLSVIKSCQENNISFVLLPTKSNHLTQPLDMAYLRQLAIKLQLVFNNWKENNGDVIPETQFPRLVGSVLKDFGEESSIHLISGFEACGIVPFNPNNVIQHITSLSSVTE